MRVVNAGSCGHFFHLKCLEDQLAEPPFGKDGCRAKRTPGRGDDWAADGPNADGGTGEGDAGQGSGFCGSAIHNSKLMTNAKLLEQRWAAKQAKARELDDVTDCFM